MNETQRTYDPAFIEWWKRQTLSAHVALALSPMFYAGMAWEEAVRQVKTDCAAMHSEQTEIRNALIDALERQSSRFDALLSRKPVRDVEETRAEVRAALRKARGEA